MIITQGYRLINLTLSLKQEQIMVYLVSDSKGLKFGILLLMIK